MDAECFCECAGDLFCFVQNRPPIVIYERFGNAKFPDRRRRNMLYKQAEHLHPGISGAADRFHDKARNMGPISGA